MSGGSYNYLCWADVSELGSKHLEIKKMASRLFELGFEDEARDTTRILEKLNKVMGDAEELQDIWYAVEWMDSGDSGIEHVRNAIAERRLKVFKPT